MARSKKGLLGVSAALLAFAGLAVGTVGMRAIAKKRFTVIKIIFAMQKLLSRNVFTFGAAKLAQLQHAPQHIIRNRLG